MDTEYDFTHNINSQQLMDEISTAGLPIVNYILTTGTAVQIFYSDALADDQLITLTNIVNAHVCNSQYVTLATQAQIAQLLGYLNNSSASIANTARAVIVANLAPNLPPNVISTINSQIAAKVGS